MKDLLDTHAFIWWDACSSNLSTLARTILNDPGTIPIVSVISVWEIIIKQQSGKLTLHLPLGAILAQQQANGMQVLPMLLPHVLALASLPMLHKDPFDRLLVAQAQAEGVSVLSADVALAGYPINVLW